VGLTVGGTNFLPNRKKKKAPSTKEKKVTGGVGKNPKIKKDEKYQRDIGGGKSQRRNGGKK